MSAMADPCSCSVCQHLAPNTPAARAASRCRHPTDLLDAHISELVSAWFRLRLDDSSNRAMLLQLPLEYTEMTDAWDVAQGQQSAKRRRVREQLELAAKHGVM